MTSSIQFHLQSAAAQKSPLTSACLVSVWRKTVQQQSYNLRFNYFNALSVRTRISATLQNKLPQHMGIILTNIIFLKKSIASFYSCRYLRFFLWNSSASSSGADSHPRFPARPGSAQHVGVCGLVQQTVHLLLHRQAFGRQLGADVVLLRSQGDRLHPAEGFVFLEAELQLLAEENQTRGERQFQRRNSSG